VEGIVLKAAWRWGSRSSGVNDPLVDPDRSSLYVELPFRLGSVDGDSIYPLYFMGVLLNWGLRYIYIYIYE
jgi:hypothetical protein